MLAAAVRAHERLRVAGGRAMWPREARNLEQPSLASERSLCMLVASLRRAFADTLTSETPLRDMWAQEALRWALSSRVPHTAGRAFQLYRALLFQASPTDTLRVVNVMRQFAEDASSDLAGVGLLLEAVVTLDVSLRRTPRDQLLLVPAAMWALVALLGSQYGSIVAASARALRSLLGRVPWQSAAVVNVILAALPSTWTKSSTNAFSGILVKKKKRERKNHKKKNNIFFFLFFFENFSQWL